MPTNPKSKVDQKILMDRFLTLRLLMEESGMIKFNNGVEIKPFFCMAKTDVISQLEILYPDKKRLIYLGEKAKDELVMSLKGMVIKKADFYHTKANATKDKLEDFIQDGWNGACYALYKFDSSEGTKFSSYADFWINARILRGSYQDYLIKANLQYEALKLTIPRSFRLFDLLAIPTDLLWIYLSRKTVYPSYPFRFHSQVKNMDGDLVDIFDTVETDDKKTLADKVLDILSPKEIEVLTSDDQSTKKTRKKQQSIGILELALMQGIPLDSFYDKKQQIINKVMERIE